MEGDSTQKTATPVQCANNCGFFGDLYPKKAEDKPTPQLPTAEAPKVEAPASAEEDSDAPTKKVQVDTSKCFNCSKKVGLLGFKCRCDYTFCSAHRYSDKHECSFDYKTAGKAALAKANPVVS
eukprot:gene10931-12738_t